MPEHGFDHDTPDVDWITKLGADNAVWIVITGDHRIRKNKAERAAWIRAGLRAFVLAPSYQKTPVHQAASTLLWRWPDMEQFISRAADGSMFELSINRKTGFEALAVKIIRKLMRRSTSHRTTLSVLAALVIARKSTFMRECNQIATPSVPAKRCSRQADLQERERGLNDSAASWARYSARRRVGVPHGKKVTSSAEPGSSVATRPSH
jgi:hypothetical protein